MKKVPAEEGYGEHEDRGSCFLAWVFPAPDMAAFERRLQELHALHPKARHHCWAWRIGDAYRFHDDGEPGGTAGRPMLQVLEGAGLEDVGAISIRYFGGVKLGTGGLARAYGGSTARAVQAAGVREVQPRCRGTLTIPFALLGLRDEISALFPGALLQGDFHDDGWHGSFEIEEAEWPRLRTLLEDRGGGSTLYGETESL